MPAADKIIIQGLRVKCVIGDYEWERQAPQSLLLDLELETNLTIAAATDRLSKQTVDYAEVAKQILGLVEPSQFQLIETLAEAVAELCLSRFPAEAVRVRVHKPQAIPQATDTVVEIFRRRPS